MKLIRAEWHKLLHSRMICGLLLCLLALNFALVWYTSKPNEIEPYVRKVYNEIYLTDPEGTQAYYQEMYDYVQENIRGGEVELPSTYFPDSGFDDYRLLRMVFSYVEEQGEYESKLNSILNLTKRQLRDLRSYGYSEDHYSVVSRVMLIERYRTLLDAGLPGNSYTYGYDHYLQTGTTTGIFLLLFLTAAVAYIFLNDSSVGFRPILHTTPCGRGSTATAKLCVACVLTLAVSLLFFLSSFAAVGLRQGYSSSQDAIQLIKGCERVPYQWSVTTYLAVHTAVRLLGYLVYGLFVAGLACIKLPYVLCFGGGAVMIGTQYYLFAKKYLGTVPPIRYMNLAAMLDGTLPLGFFRTVSLFGLAVQQIIFMVVLLLLLCAVLWLLGTWFYCKNYQTLASKASRVRAWMGTKWRDLSDSLRKHAPKRRRYHSQRLITYEWAKWRYAGVLVLVVLLIAAKGVYTARTAGSMETFGEARYRAYITDLQTLDREAQREYIQNEQGRIEELLSSAEDMKEKYAKGEIDRDTYNAFTEQFYRARAEQPIIERVDTYARGVWRSADTLGTEPQLIYDTGYVRYFSGGVDVFFYLAVIALCVRCFGVEYSEKGSGGGFIQILRSTKLGRSKTFLTKLAATVPLASLCALAFRVTALLTVADAYVLPNSDAPLCSVSLFGQFPLAISIGSYMALDLLFSLLVGALIGCVICLVSCYAKHTLPTISLTLLITGVPALLKALLTGVSPAWSLLSWTQPDTLYQLCAASQSIPTAIITVLLYTITIFATTAYTYVRFSGGRITRR